MTDLVNLFDMQEWDAENDREGFRHRRTAVGARLGATLLGGSLYELPLGERTWPYHYEEGCEEWLIVLSGNPVLRSADGERELRPGDVAVFREGPSGAHQVINGSSQACRVLVLSSKAPVAIARFPDSGKVGLWSEARGELTILRAAPELDYWDGEATVSS